jgi:hypothetical protein
VEKEEGKPGGQRSDVRSREPSAGQKRAKLIVERAAAQSIFDMGTLAGLKRSELDKEIATAERRLDALRRLRAYCAKRKTGQLSMRDLLSQNSANGDAQAAELLSSGILNLPR